eukprot:Lithocolla_globosa_v1_NODE_140_length_5790_cov_49.678989.p6 type:complete len:176 gc:universal NODE_140_length_5790_cov_49.678989:3612-4139(+)
MTCTECDAIYHHNHKISKDKTVFYYPNATNKKTVQYFPSTKDTVLENALLEEVEISQERSHTSFLQKADEYNRLHGLHKQHNQTGERELNNKRLEEAYLRWTIVRWCQETELTDCLGNPSELIDIDNAIQRCYASLDVAFVKRWGKDHLCPGEKNCRPMGTPSVIVVFVLELKQV